MAKVKRKDAEVKVTLSIDEARLLNGLLWLVDTGRNALTSPLARLSDALDDVSGDRQELRVLPNGCDESYIDLEAW